MSRPGRRKAARGYVEDWRRGVAANGGAERVLFRALLADPQADVFSWPAGSLDSSEAIGAVVVLGPSTWSAHVLTPAGKAFCSGLERSARSDLELLCALECDWVPRSLRGGVASLAAGSAAGALAH